jgi:hypothetical protein
MDNGTGGYNYYYYYRPMFSIDAGLSVVSGDFKIYDVKFNVINDQTINKKIKLGNPGNPVYNDLYGANAALDETRYTEVLKDLKGSIEGYLGDIENLEFETTIKLEINTNNEDANINLSEKLGDLLKWVGFDESNIPLLNFIFDEDISGTYAINLKLKLKSFDLNNFSLNDIEAYIKIYEILYPNETYEKAVPKFLIYLNEGIAYINPYNFKYVSCLKPFKIDVSGIMDSLLGNATSDIANPLGVGENIGFDCGCTNVIVPIPAAESLIYRPSL